MKRISTLLLCVVMCLSWSSLAFAEETVLKVYNWQDYIDEGIISLVPEKKCGCSTIPLKRTKR